MTDRERAGHDADAPAAAEATGLLTIDLAAIVANWRDLAARARPAACAAVVKADAYGCGIGPVTAALYRAGCRTFFVAQAAEGRSARGCAPDAAIYVLSGFAPGGASALAADDLRPVISSVEEMAEWSAFVAAESWSGAAALHVDTGMNRLGLPFDAAAALAGRPVARQGAFALLMSHLAVADDPVHPLNARQVGLFRELRDLFPGMPGSLANSSGIFLGPDAHHDLVRPGVALYGINPTPAHPNPMRPVVGLQGRILQVRELDAGEAVGYGATWTARRTTRLAVVGVGYADGFPRSASSSDLKAGADVLIAGRRCPLAGRVSMDLLAVDVTDLPADLPRRGDVVTLLGDTIGVDELASHAGTIGYEILTRLGPRYHRTYLGA
jgi:alanine racemase